MVWTSLIGNTSKINSLPKILCGPILRRVDKKSVSVFLVFKDEIEARLEIYSTQDGNYYEDINVAARSSAKDTYIKPEKLGTNLYVICLTAKIEYGSDLDLSEGITYYYDLIFKNGDTFDRLKESTNNKYLTEDVGSILLDSKLLPSFLLPRNELPSDDSNHLKIFHASCRKPHGNSKDGLSNAFNVLNNSNVMGYVRPQMLFLTGDQIYADDVSDILLKIIRDAQYSLMGWHETLPNISGNYNLTDLNYDQSLDPILQGKRGEVIVNLANFTVDEKLAQSHLITLGDFFMMYVFSWSTSLWQDNLPSFEEVYPGESISKDYSTILSFNDNLNEKYGSKLNFDTKLKRKYDKECDLLLDFKESLKDVKKLLANIPTYMLLDDHEVTDDLFITAQWCEDTIGINGSQLGKRVITNGLTAYTIFQAWGNTPQVINSSTIFNEVEDIANGVSTNWNSLESLVLPHFNINTGQGESYYLTKPNIKFEYILPFENFEVLVIDTRCYRGYAELDSKPKIISTGNMEFLLSQDNLENPYKNNNKFSIVITPTPFKDSVIFKKAKFAHSVSEGDKESWDYSLGSQLLFLSKLFKRSRYYTSLNVNSINHKIVFLSGDVHFAFTKRVEMLVHEKAFDYKSKQRVESGRLLAALLCASSLKNEVGGLTGSKFMNFMHYEKDFNKKFEVVDDDVNNTITAKSAKNELHFHLRIDHIERVAGNISVNRYYDLPPPQYLSSYVSYSSAQGEHMKFPSFPNLYVGFNNFGEVDFKITFNELSFVFHKLHFIYDFINFENLNESSINSSLDYEVGFDHKL